MSYLIGFVIATIGFVVASIHLQQEFASYYDFVALAVVVGGTIAVLVSGVPKQSLAFTLKHFFASLLHPQKKKKNFIQYCLQVTQRSSASYPDYIEKQILSDGLEMIDLGFSKKQTTEIITNRFMHYRKSILNIATWLKRSAKYPPAFGLAGTVLGLIHLMRGISEGTDPKETGVRMAIALVATFYGLILSNLVLNPISEVIIEKLKMDEDYFEISLKTLELIYEKENLVVVQESLNSHATSFERVNMIGAMTGDAA